MRHRLRGIHHITAIARDGEQCIEFYCGVLGLRLVKVTINYDDPSSYHIYFSDHRASLGTLLTFFLWPGAPGGGADMGQVERIAYAVPRGSFDFWRKRLDEHEIDFDIGEAITLRDPDGLTINLVEEDEDVFRDVEPTSLVPAEYALGPFHGATLAESDLERTAAFLEETLGFERMEQRGGHRRFGLPDGSELQLAHRPDARRRTLTMAPGVVHHIAFRAKDDEEQQAWRERVMHAGLRVTDVRERTYFRSIYFREPGGVLFEIATEQPGMAADEPVEELGHRLMLPKWLEKDRSKIIAQLPPLVSPETGAPVATPIHV